jgi:hypothetical protein
MVLIAYEDIGLANPAIPQRVATACEQFRKVGMPEGRIILGLAGHRNGTFRKIKFRLFSNGSGLK